ncbi:sugar ABC transporter substrate-binding protein [Agrobacterium tumefaciens]|uniref:ABC transporter, substrate binding protein (Sugar) n=1 Tax=Agrobacterium fabrum (strain C58 / ATCC 33970) TaxID=176299 RepID=A9CEN9_AGRFC|nr:extracellular solute-binding protein [Agrobacterium fabrum]KEY53856.1 sugar ABC transporter substrate-binding protein [Agrobacterium tumefaciens]AAK90281.1 ABC transporter, substrate binding protein (sugar) [Agrobacterium fabrum str. C58]AYM58923.1 multiple sugar transport system substrate-binding protein [Agrobacterium fabrum]KJX87108.1 sn-glycerol-3-phosphate-binding periplasmic protein ugpB [Agrobacterium tumefaciens]MCX2877871.1 extracellular solute-binding protein [Agrobacterium fabrum
MRLIKTLLVGTVLGLTALPALAKQDIVWWDFLSGGDGVRMKALIDAFNKEHPDIQVKGTTLEWGVPFYTKVRTASAVGEGPDVMTYHLSRAPLALQEKVLSEITDKDLEEAGLKKDDFFSAPLEAATHDGKLYAVPFDIHALVLYYNADLLKGSPYLDAEGKLTGIKSMDDFEKALAWAKEKGVQTPVTYQSGGEAGVWRVFYTLFSQQGGELVTNGEVLAGDNAEKAAKAIDTMSKWRENSWAPEQAEYPASVALFSAGKSAFQLNGVWEVPTYKDLEKNGKLGFKWSAVEVPPFMGKRATWADSHAFAIPNQGDKTVSGEKRAAVMKVIGWMEKHAISWADAGHIPAYKSITESSDYKAMQPNATYASLAEAAEFDPKTTITGVASPAYDAALNVIAPAIQGFMSGTDAVEQIKEELQSKLK